MCKPIIATVGLFAGLGYWNDWTNGLYYITDTNKFSIQQLLNNMIKNIEFLSKNANSNINLASVGGESRRRPCVWQSPSSDCFRF